MKILHTSDWHLGQTWSGRPRKKEFEAFLDWMFQTLRERAVDVLIVAGDVFDISSPATETQKMYFQFLKKVSTVCPNTIITAGNHDSPHLLDVPKPFLNEFGIHVVGVASGPEDELVVLGNGNDDTNSPPRLIVAAVPFLRDREIRRAVEGESFEESENRTIAGIKAHYGTVCAAAEEIRSRYPGQKIPLIATGHLFVAGIETPGAVREIHVGTLGRLGCDVFPDGIDYVALGHIHRPSAVGGRETIRYSGSPIPMSFEEAGQEKSVVLVEFGNADFDGEVPRIETIPVPRFSHFQRIEGDLEVIFAAFETLNRQGEADDRDIFVEVVYTGAEPVHDLVRRVEDAVKSRQIEIVRISNEREKMERRWNFEPDENLDDLTETDVFDRLLEDTEKSGSPLDDGLKSRLRQAYREVLECCFLE